MTKEDNTAYQLLLNWNRLYEWAEEKEAGSIVGESCTNSSCPLANYLNDQTGKLWSVGPSIRLADKTPQDRLYKPKWVKSMIEATDKATNHKSEKVTREMFLVILDQVQNEMEPYTPTPADEALYLGLLTGNVCLKIQQEYSGGNMKDLETYNRLYEAARKADVQARILFEKLEGQQ